MESTAFQSFTTTTLQRTKEYKLCLAAFRQSLPDGRRTAWVKIYRVVGPDALREAAILQRTTDLKVNIVRYLHQIYGKDRKFYVFFEPCDRVLAEEIRLRKQGNRPWTETELLSHVETMAKTLFQLHALRLVHRSISINSVFTQGSTVLLGHFDSAKQISLGITHVDQSIYTADSYLSPESYGAVVRNTTGLTYEMAYKEDVWSLGVTVYNMALLQGETRLEPGKHISQTEFSASIARSLTGKYSPRVIKLLCSMLILDPVQRPSVTDILEALEKTAAVCERCKQDVEMNVWPCGQISCLDCFSLWLKHLLISRVREIKCHCGGAVPVGFYQVKLGVMAGLVQEPEVKCGKCGAVFPKIRPDGGHFRAYEARCACGALCSLCGLKGAHRLLGVRRPCPLLRSLSEFL